MSRVVEVYRDLAELFFPLQCLGCERGGRVICRRCWVMVLGYRFSEISTAYGTTPVFYGADYSSEARELVLGLKTKNRLELASFWGYLLLRQLRVAFSRLGPAPLLVAPSKVQTYRRRGYHPLLEALASQGVRAENQLFWRREVADQALQRGTGRVKNLSGSLGANLGARYRRFWLVEDVITTGSTVEETLRALGEVSAGLRGVVAMFRPPGCESVSLQGAL